MLTINGIDISKFNAKIVDRIIESNEVITVDDWLEGALEPIFIRQNEKFKNITIRVLIESRTEEETYNKFSKLTSELKKSILKFNDMKLTFKGTLIGAVSPIRIKPGVFDVEYKIKCSHGIGEEIEYKKADGDTNKTFSINNIGTANTPCIIEIIPTIDIVKLSLTGFSDKAIVLNDIKKNIVVKIDGESKRVLYGDKDGFAKFEGWSFPYIKSGANNLTVDNSAGYELKVKYKPRFI